MYFIVPFVFFIVGVWILYLIVGGSILKFSPSMKYKVENKIASKPRPFIKLGANLIPINEKEVGKAKKDGFTVIYQ